MQDFVRSDGRVGRLTVFLHKGYFTFKLNQEGTFQRGNQT